MLVWQLSAWDQSSHIPPLVRLHRAARWGIPVGRGYRKWGGLRLDTALRLECLGLALLDRTDEEDIVWAYACQLHFDFTLGKGWNVYV